MTIQMGDYLHKMTKPIINLWLLNYQSKRVSYDQVVQRLAPPQSDRINSFKSDKRKLEFAISRLLLTHAIVNELGNDLLSFVIRERQGLPPAVISDAADINLSISHSGDWVAVIASRGQKDGQLGLDVESMQLNWTQTKASYFCNQQQLNYSASLARVERQRYLTRLWTQKEAFFKAQEVSVFNARTKSVDFTGNMLMHSASLNDDYQFSLYCSQPIEINSKFVVLDSAAGVISAANTAGHKHLLNWA
jgi:phosphopantetheinyl transferase